jgi:hypothetical protein
MIIKFKEVLREPWFTLKGGVIGVVIPLCGMRRAFGA